jgi:3-oxoacyl-[acyl-carrier protein] reductase
MNNYEGQVVLITGATRGIGASIAETFATTGADLILTGTNQKQIDQLNAESDRVGQYFCVDFDSNNSLTNFLTRVSDLDRLDVCINNAGINPLNEIDKVLIEDFDRTTRVNFRAPYLICQEAIRKMKVSSYGRILNIGSIWASSTKIGRSTYSASKAGLVGMTRAIATDVGRFNILVNAISPGFVLTDLTRSNLSEEDRRELASQVPLGRFAEPEEIAKVAAFLCSKENTFITGQDIIVDGGFTNA